MDTLFNTLENQFQTESDVTLLHLVKKLIFILQNLPSESLKQKQQFENNGTHFFQLYFSVSPEVFYSQSEKHGPTTDHSDVFFDTENLEYLNKNQFLKNRESISSLKTYHGGNDVVHYLTEHKKSPFKPPQNLTQQFSLNFSRVEVFTEDFEHGNIQVYLDKCVIQPNVYFFVGALRLSVFVDSLESSRPVQFVVDQLLEILHQSDKLLKLSLKQFRFLEHCSISTGTNQHYSTLYTRFRLP